MAKQDYIPRQDTEFLAWHDNFKTQAAAVAATVGLIAADTTVINNDNAELHTKHTAMVTAKAAQQAATAGKKNSFRNVSDRTRALANRIKTHAAYTTAIGEQLGIVGAEDTTDLNTAKPTLRLTAATPGNVRIEFNKGLSDGVRILSKRGSETAFSFLAIDTESPYIDTRPNLAPGPETRQYQAQYILSDEPIGNLSDVLPVTVPG
jgi:hypothetical protein